MSKFEEGERVLCFHGPLLYEARCHKVNTEGEVDLYLIHYNGWSQKWDEWIPETRILKFNDINLKKQTELIKHHKKTQNRGKNKKMKFIENVESEDAFASKVCIHIELPSQLKLAVLDDWDLITQQKHLLKLPAASPVSVVLDEFRVYSLSVNKTSDINRDHVLEGLLGYFSRLLGMQLLYKFERPQYADTMEEHKGMSVCDIYGTEHLLRLFTRIGELLAFTELDNNAITVLQKYIHQLLNFIEIHRGKYLSAENYFVATPDYLRRAAL
ncbi:mortality factor 4-like protein 1 [Bolinopsis microptera]|uniref:mortality factor 4-like protein 1 n=1 Tax=Bolinopsis microptera TaxID=2820187 RepID=UPI00307A4E54